MWTQTGNFASPPHDGFALKQIMDNKTFGRLPISAGRGKTFSSMKSILQMITHVIVFHFTTMKKKKHKAPSWNASQHTIFLQSFASRSLETSSIQKKGSKRLATKEGLHQKTGDRDERQETTRKEKE